MALGNTLKLIFLSVISTALLTGIAKPKNQAVERVLKEARSIFEQFQVSYVYGGAKLGGQEDCLSCNQCLREQKPAPKKRLKACPLCLKCSLDCSHFTQLVFKNAALYAPYLTTVTMLDLSSFDLAKKYKLLDLGQRFQLAKAGDLLVYRGHVVLLTKRYADGKVDIIHATGGKDIRQPGQGVQVERLVFAENFRGPLLRVLRHKSLVAGR